MGAGGREIRELWTKNTDGPYVSFVAYSVCFFFWVWIPRIWLNFHHLVSFPVVQDAEAEALAIAAQIERFLRFGQRMH